MSQIEIPRALSDEVLSRYAQLRIDRGDREVWPPELALELNQDDIHEALSAALEGWLVQEAWIGRDIDGGYTRLYQQESEFEHHKGKDWFRADPLYTLRKDKTP